MRYELEVQPERFEFLELDPELELHDELTESQGEVGRRAPPGGGFFQRPQREIPRGLPGGGYFPSEGELEIGPARCVPTTPIITNPAAVGRAVGFNTRSARSIMAPGASTSRR